jgi:integrase
MKNIDDFVSQFTPKTQTTYKCVLRKYYNIINKNPETYFNGKRHKTEKELELYEEDIKKYYNNIKQMPPNTIFSYLGCIRVYLQDNYVDLPNAFWRQFRKRKKGNRAVVQDIVPSKQQFKKLLTHGSALERALILTLLSSGMRIGEVCQIKENDIDFDFIPTKIEIRGEYTKTGNRRTTFVTDECTEALKEWLKEKPKWLEQSVKKLNFNRYTKNTTDDRIFPMHTQTARVKWNRLLEKAKEEFNEKDKSTAKERYKIHPHVTRKYFRTWMAKDIGRDLTEYFLGHEEGLDNVYRRYGDDSNKRILGDEYLKGVKNVSVFEIEADLTEVNKEITQLTKENEDLKKRLDYLDHEFRSLMIEEIKKVKKD